MKKAGGTPPQAFIHALIMANQKSGAASHSAVRNQHSSKHIQSLTRAAAARLGVAHTPIPPKHCFEADVAADRKLAAVMCAIAQVANQRGTTFTQQIETWEAGE